MLCNECGKNQATIHTIQYVNGVKSEMHLCAECAKNHPELKTFGLFSSADVFKSFFNNMLIEPGLAEEVPLTCKTCGESLDDFTRTGLLGCPECYDAFRDRLIPVLQRTHGNVQHAGEAPEGVEEKAKNRKKLSQLKEKLSEAITKEDFEQAAKLRDKINALKEKGE